MNKDKIIKNLKKIIIFVVFVLIVWFLILNPFIKFKINESKMLEASKRYFEVNSNELPTGDRTKTIYLKDLYSKAFLKEDFYVPLTNKACSVTESWTRVRRENGEYKYYTYLKCGVLSSIVDHKGPEITLNGKDEITIDKDSKYIELGVKNVRDNKDGNLDVNSVEINSKKVNTKKIGTYQVKYTVFDKLRNKTEKIRKVKVVSRLKNVIKKQTNNLGYYKGMDPNNYIYFSNMLFRIVDIENGNVKIIASEDIANVNYSGIEKWLDNYFYEHLNKKSKEYIVNNKYCNMNINNTNVNSTNCDSYTNKRKSYIISTTDINRSLENSQSFLKPTTLSWTSNKYDSKNAFVTRDVFFENDYGKNVLPMDSSYNYGVRPVITIKGDSLIEAGNGTYENPYSLDDVKIAKAKDKLNTRHTGEYIEYSGYLWRIIEVNNDRTKVIMNNTLKSSGDEVETFYDTNNNAKIYNPKQKGNVGYFIKNKTSQYLNLEIFDKTEVKVPIYKNLITYGKEIKTKTYKTKLSAPNMYEMFSAFSAENSNTMASYWLINSSKTEERKGVITEIGYVINEKTDDYHPFGVRPVGNIKSSITIVSGTGTPTDPYIIAD